MLRQAAALKEQADNLDGGDKVEGKAKNRQTNRSRDWPKVRRNPPNPEERCKPYDRQRGGGGDRGGRRGRRGGRKGGGSGGITISFGAGAKCWQKINY